MKTRVNTGCFWNILYELKTETNRKKIRSECEFVVYSSTEQMSNDVRRSFERV